MDKKSHLKIEALVSESVFSFVSPLCRMAYIYGSVEPDLNVFTYLKGHWERKREGDVISALSALENKRFWTLYDFYKAGRISHYIVDSFTFPHTPAFSGSMKSHIEWEKKLAKSLFSMNEVKVRRGIGFDFKAIKDNYRKETPSIENDISYSVSALFLLLRSVYSPEFAFPFAVGKIVIR